jgi:hypothetical protein
MRSRTTLLALRAVLGAMVALVVAMGLAAPASAHSGSFDMKFVDGQRLILITFNTHLPASGLRIMHNIRLYDLGGTPIPYKDVQVSVAEQGLSNRFTLRGGDAVDLVAPMRDTNDSSVTFTYPQQGRYSLVATFRGADGAQLARGEFAVDVAKGVGGSGLPLGTLFLAVVAFVLGAVCTWGVMRRHDGGRPATGSGDEAGGGPGGGPGGEADGDADHEAGVGPAVVAVQATDSEDAVAAVDVRQRRPKERVPVNAR